MVAIFAAVLAGMVGLTIDRGYTFAERRSVQNAADAAALAGAHALTLWSASNPSTSADTDVSTVVAGNAMNGATTQIYTCTYVDDTNTDLGPCSNPVPTKPTAATGTSTGGGGGSSTSTINQAAYGQTFILHGPQVADCGRKSNSFKGLADPNANANQSVPGWFDSLTGVKAGPTRTRVNGINGCQPGDASTDGCVLILPIATNNPAPSGNSFYVVTTAAFFVRHCGANCHEGVLLENYQVQPDGLDEWTGSHGWKPGDKGLVTVRLTN